MSETIRNFAPVAVFAYNRVDKLENCISHLELCPEVAKTELFLFCDGAKSDKDRERVRKVQEYAHKYSGANPFKKVTVCAQENNKGLAASIISGVTDVVNEYGRVVVVEDDLVVLPSFLNFMNEGLEYYRENEKCGSICAFS